ncbi:MAG TPA: hypothetical protein VMJ30_08430 [Gemmatimonadales bacterium]|nr:hypothetical protein [Gemmatimonadales bacterium]
MARTTRRSPNAPSRIIENPGVPAYWPAICGSYDLVAAGYLAWLIRSGRVRAAAQ